MEVISQQIHTVTILEVSHLVESPFECTVLAGAGVLLLFVVVSFLQCVLNGRLITALLLVFTRKCTALGNAHLGLGLTITKISRSHQNCMAMRHGHVE